MEVTEREQEKERNSLPPFQLQSIGDVEEGRIARAIYGYDAIRSSILPPRSTKHALGPCSLLPPLPSCHHHHHPLQPSPPSPPPPPPHHPPPLLT
eukprot:760844-Hanusia_phi.AAC.2